MNKIKIFTNIDSKKLEEDVNKWLADQPRALINDIRYVVNNLDGSLYYNYSVLIYYSDYIGDDNDD